MKKTSLEIRKRFLEYFQKEGHSIVSSSPVIPFEDPTLLFNNAGMNQFKDVFLGKSHRDYKRAATSQKCIRAGGKHNDLENVGHTTRHLTFFEMLGNFSFGEYFKKEAIRFSWEVATKIFGFAPERIWPTVFVEDDEAFELWKAYVPESRITRMGAKDNFWEMGDVGPCGPCSELYYDRGESFGPGKNPADDATGERYLEFWNLVFMQFNRNPDGSMTPLPRPSIDTGAGLERVISLMLGVESVFETDVLRGIIAKVEELSGIPYDLNDKKRSPAFRVIADHIRTLSFAIADGAQPSNVERGYVLRKILRRAVRYGKMLGFEAPFLGKLVPTLISFMADAYPELATAQNRIQEIVTGEEEQFFKTLKRGGALLSQILERSMKEGIISGDDAFKLKDTYGLPLEEIQLIALDSNMKVDLDRYKVLEIEAKEKSKAKAKATEQQVESSFFEELKIKWGETQFIRNNDKPCSSNVLGIIREGQLVEKAQEGDVVEILLAETPFYAEMGGQVGDIGVLESPHVTITVQNCSSPYKGLTVHRGVVVKGSVAVQDCLTASIDRMRRNKVECNHTATHLLHWALHRVCGEHVRQAGSVVEANRLRFDFSHNKPLEPSEIEAIEKLVNHKIRENHPVQAYEMAYDEIKSRHEIKQFFGEKYGSVVRVVDLGESKELCGGTHTTHTGNIGYFRIAKESSIAAGTRRIEAVTGEDAEELAYASDRLLTELAAKLSAPVMRLKDSLDKLVEEKNGLQQKLESIESAKMQELVRSFKPHTSSQGLLVIHHMLSQEGVDLKELAEVVAKQHPQAVIALGVILAGKAQVLVRVPSGSPLDASALLKEGLGAIQGKGGGRKEMAQGAGMHIAGLEQALQMIVQKL